ncbi:MAG: type II secretion system protein GspK [Planctomycetota bacterium]|nr:type II secretion system protein GspK [Planctomycetota bacterium]
MKARAFYSSRRNPQHGGRHARHRGIIFITALGVIIVLSGMVLVFAQEMRTEALASANRLSYAQADAIEQGAEQWVLANIEGWSSQNPGDAVDIIETPAEALQVGNGYFWLIRPLEGDTTQYDYGIVDEGGKLNLNTATATELLAFPDMTSDVAYSITNWVGAGAPNANGSDSDYYGSLPEPYTAKHSEFETVDELNLVAGVTPQLLYGFDLNRDGVIDQAETTAGGLGTMFNSSGADARGIFPYVTVYNSQPASGAPNSKATHLVNINTAPEQVLLCLGLDQTDADTLIAARPSADLSSQLWVATALGTPKARALFAGANPRAGVKSFQYSADIVAVSGDGRAFKRVRIVVDVQKVPAKIVYRRDLTSLGWPLPAEIRATLRAGHAIATGGASSGNGGASGNSSVGR